MPEESAAEAAGAELVVEFVRYRNAMHVHGDMAPLFTDYYLHLADHRLHHPPEIDRMFKDALAAFVLHCASRPRNEHLAWTLSLQSPLVNLFLAGDNEDGLVTGRVFTENVKPPARNLLYCDLVPRRGAERRRSVVNFDGTDALLAAQAFHAGSEQRPARFFYLGGDSYSMLVSHPDCDEAWFAEVNPVSVRTLAERETLASLERRRCRWECGCSQRRMLGVLAQAARDDLAGLFGGEESIRVQCPRCAATHLVTREAMEAHLASSRGP